MKGIKLHNYLQFLYLRYIKGIDSPARFIRFFSQRYAGRIVIKEGEKELTMDALNRRVNCLANSLMDLGMHKGDRIGVLLKNSIEYIEIRLVAYKTGLVFCAMIYDFSPEQVVQKISEMKFRAFFCEDPAMVETILQLPDEDQPKYIIQVYAAENENRAITYPTLITGGNCSEPLCNTQPGDISAIGFTSGTTGVNKGVVWNHRAWLQSFYHFMLNTDRTDGDMRLLQFIPFSTAGSLTILPWLASGGKMIIRKDYSADEISECITEEKITNLTIAPVFLIDLWDYYLVNRDKYNFDSLKSISVGSAPLPGDKLKQIIETFGPIIQQSYGMAEVLAPIASIRITDPLQECSKLTSVGVPIKQVKVKLADLDERGCRRIRIKSKTACLGYWKPDGINRTCFRQNWFLSDDIGSFDRNKHLYIRERKARIIDNDGRIIYPRDIEEVIHGFPGVQDVIVFRPDNSLLACLSARRNYSIDIGKLKQYCHSKLPDDHIPDDFIVLNKLPVSSSGKTLKPERVNKKSPNLARSQTRATKQY